MTPLESLEEYYGEMKLMFRSKGWDFLLDELRENARVINNLQSVKDDKDLYFKQGQMATIATLLTFEETLKMAETEEREDPYEGPQ